MRNPLTKEAFAEWCAKQPAERRYVYGDSRKCACAQFFRAKGYKSARYVGLGEWINDDDARNIGRGLDYYAAGSPKTFGALAARLREGAAS